MNRPKRLIHQILAWDNLVAAWNKVRETKGAAGSDGVSVKRWARNWEERLVNLRRTVMANTYRPAPLERFTVPKRSGGVRHMTNLTVTDKVLQRAVLNVLDDIFEAIFLDGSFGYRPGRGLKDAVAAIVAYRDAGLNDVLDDDPIVLRLIKLWLHQGRRNPDEARGIPLGAVISPLLCNVYLHRLDLGLYERGYVAIRYADDWVALCASPAEARRARRDAEQILVDLKLKLEPAKTRLTSFDEGFEYLGVTFYRRTYSYDYQSKRIEVEGPFDGWLFSQTGPEGYQ
jgi:retron-type reverse transcriptase